MNMRMHAKEGHIDFVRAILISTLFVVTISIVACDAGPFKSADSLKTDARQSIEAKNYSDAALRAQKLIDKAPEDFDGYFLLAQAKAQTGDNNAALVALEKSIKKGLKDDTLIDKNSNLEPIKQMSAFKDLMSSNFPSRQTAAASGGSTSAGDASVSIQESNGKQIIRAGDVVVEIPVQ
jgi:hypothetical protein